MGKQLAWSGHSIIWPMILAAMAPKKVMEKASLAAAVEKFGQPKDVQITDLLGPRRGLPKKKEELILLAGALGLDQTGTVKELELRCREALGTTRGLRSACRQSVQEIRTGVGGGAQPSTGSASSGSSSRPAESALVLDLTAQLESLRNQLRELQQAPPQRIVTQELGQPTLIAPRQETSQPTLVVPSAAPSTSRRASPPPPQNHSLADLTPIQEDDWEMELETDCQASVEAQEDDPEYQAAVYASMRESLTN